MSFFDSPYTVNRNTVAGYRDAANGNKWVEGTVVPLSIRMNIQPITDGEVMESLPEGRREKSNIVAHCNEELRVLDEVAGLAPDIIVHQGQDYEVWKVEPWADLIPHYRATASLV